MSLGREHPRWAPLGLVLLQLFACSLGSDYEPARFEEPPAQEEATPDVLPAAMLQQAAVPPVELAEDAKSSVTETIPGCPSSDLPDCELMRAGSAPSRNAECTADSDCASQHCSEGSCVAASCSDGLRNQGESAVDC
ncbi:MAG TPA: hypothetical protein VJU61_09230, partial [Polyangiaceae bacterium]|nr:hypothetical protein [Polyangiaceae bacterium]